MTASMLATPYASVPLADKAVSDDLARFMPLLNRLRFLATTCRADARLDLASACSAIHVDRERSLDALATAMIRVVSEAIDGHVIFLAPGSPNMTFDEEWLTRLLDRAAQRDTVSVEFLLRRRVPKRNHHAFRSIVRAIGALLRS